MLNRNSLRSCPEFREFPIDRGSRKLENDLLNGRMGFPSLIQSPVTSTPTHGGFLDRETSNP
jgi:hypothetical protein